MAFLYCLSHPSRQHSIYKVTQYHANRFPCALLGQSRSTSLKVFVALSRIKSLDGLLLTGKLDYSRVKNLGGAQIKQRQEDWKRRYGTGGSSLSSEFI
ncbi:uncharacterized protein SCHCODRAFT_02628971 [Schizophyllum commune H4-8]|uniref:uncharacterized protein n=1 Tax=Schizophyllum commune (strain H4-8 / FGSC 9210) TaxID=578458 RepID=UPI00215E599F|nr:uncharacterized protein SCHCODRAFT_02628971 [Schizophyllum commune H4-8]KAI5891393.1 hypothetical protein SCHCODRAFT_02628971 [Schizophyllum commune H4-8]